MNCEDMTPLLNEALVLSGAALPRWETCGRAFRRGQETRAEQTRAEHVSCAERGQDECEVVSDTIMPVIGNELSGKCEDMTPFDGRCESDVEAWK